MEDGIQLGYLGKRTDLAVLEKMNERISDSKGTSVTDIGCECEPYVSTASPVALSLRDAKLKTSPPFVSRKIFGGNYNCESAPMLVRCSIWDTRTVCG